MAEETELERIVVRIIGDNASYIKSLTQAQDQTKRSMKDIEQVARDSQERIQKDRQSLGQAIGGAGIAASFFSLGREALAGFGEAELAELKLTAALESNGRAVEKTLNSYKEYANQLQEVTTMEDDAVIALFKTAELYEVTGDAAKRAIHDAVALAAANDSSVEAMIRITSAMAKGDTQTAMRFARMIPQLRGVRDEAVFLEKYTKLVATGFKLAQAEAGTFTGQMKQLKVAWGNLLEDFGEVLADWLKPIISGFKTVVGWFKMLSKESKQTIAIIAAGLAAIGLAAFISALNSVFPIFSAFMGVLKAIGAVLMSILSPIGLVVAAVAGLAYYVLFYTQSGADAITWFGEQWQKLVDYVKPALDAIKNALAAGEINLAARILWAQLKVIWFQGIAPLREAWIGFKHFMAQVFTEIVFGLEYQWARLPLTWAETIGFLREAWAGFVASFNIIWIEGSTKFKSTWQATTDWLGKQMLKLKAAFRAAGEMDPEEIEKIKQKTIEEMDEIDQAGKTVQQSIANTRQQLLAESNAEAAKTVDEVKANIAKVEAQLKPALDKITQLKKEALGELDNMAAQEMLDAQKNVDNLKAELSDLIEKGNLAKQLKKEGDDALPEAQKIGKSIAKAMNQWEAVEFRSAEALSRQLASVEAIASGAAAAKGGGKGGGKGAGGGAGAGGQPGGMQPQQGAAPPMDEADDDLADIAAGINELVRIGREQLREPRVELETAGLV